MTYVYISWQAHSCGSEIMITQKQRDLVIAWKNLLRGFHAKSLGSSLHRARLFLLMLPVLFHHHLTWFLVRF